ncbi:MAG TPA: methylmalonyl-CoA mutase family protein [Acidobacteriota bacterium]|jgi:methylmalonyl-CoA mutase N-terminal domain/subunit|nr:methylmalonyl-CoA mutase [Acidobacteriota bacterium]HJO30322.1 methylmalonyl-CoA mutase family protein [Acidobacteriota bacterium]|tara:strand:- start:7327 stop:9054 length:1728 start_codon:yes stop_codon:yes gene_type:complete
MSKPTKTSKRQLRLWDEEAVEAIRASSDSWRQQYSSETSLAKPLQTAPGRASGETKVQALHTPIDIDRWSFNDELGFPGEYPLTRGIYPSMYRGRLWTMRQYAGFATAEDTNERFRYLLDRGQTGLSTAFDLPTQIGYDSDHPMALGEVGRVGVAIDSVRDMEVLFDGIDIAKVTTSMTINATAGTLLTLYCALADRRGVGLEQLGGTVQNDILKEYIARGTYIYPPAASLRLVTDTFRFCAKRVPRWNTISISGYHIREAGSTAVQEIAFTLGNAIAYTEAGLSAGLAVDDFAPRLSFFFNAHNHLLEEVAKFRAARRLWARIMKERFGAANPKAWRMRFHAQTAGSTLTAQQPFNNVVRVAVQALAATLGGCQSLHTNGMDEALALPTERSARTALRTQQLLAYEHGAGDVIDPLGGSFTIEKMTTDLEEEAAVLIGEIDKLGGMVAAIEAGYVQRQIEKAAYGHQLEIESGERPVVGINCFEEEERSDPQIAVHAVPEGLEKRKAVELEAWRVERDSDAVERALDTLYASASSDGNVVEAIFEAVKQEATLGEVADRLRDAFGEYRDPSCTA